MLCDDCKKRPARVHMTKIVNNQKTEKHLCEHCAQSLGEFSFNVEANFSVQDLLKGIFNTSVMEGVPARTEAACEQCGMTYSDFSRTGKIGCSHCYETFGSRLEPLVRRVHATCGHTGKVPKRAAGALALKQKQQTLRRQLADCIGREEYEQAARIRDEIRSLEKSADEQTGGTGDVHS